MKLDELMAELAEEIRDLGIPVSQGIERKVRLNSRAKRRLGCCIYKEGKCIIEVSASLLGEPQLLRETLAHELLHTCPGCRNHGALWKMYAERLNDAWGYRISRTVERKGEKVAAPAPVYLLKCLLCGREIGRTRCSKVIQAPSKYRCPCGGTLKRIK